ncbi:MAG: ATP-binding protein, partial [Pirellulaceae bacterium]|nr:ATP-binding protein [Pirellulaceae bacterium]
MLIEPGVPTYIRSDPVRLRQVLFNIVANAFKFTSTGSVTVHVSKRNLECDDCEIRFEIADTGIGISADALPTLFEKFTQADTSTTRQYGGTGLGLAISKQLVEKMGGEIGVESVVGEGTMFWFTIRCEQREEATKVAAVEDIAGHEPSAYGGNRPLRILVAEDHQANQMVITAILEKAGHHADLVSNGLEAVEAVKQSPYDLVLMDIQMPEMDGLAATQEIRKLAGDVSDIPIVALTANAMAGDQERYLATGMSDYVGKPIVPELLFAAMRRCVRSETETNDSSAAAPRVVATNFNEPVLDTAAIAACDMVTDPIDDQSSSAR